MNMGGKHNHLTYEALASTIIKHFKLLDADEYGIAMIMPITSTYHNR